MLLDVGAWVGTECSGDPIFFYYYQNNCAKARHHTQPNINTFLTRNLVYDSDVRYSSHPLITPLHYLLG